jgi:hypothetical protein
MGVRRGAFAQSPQNTKTTIPTRIAKLRNIPTRIAKLRISAIDIDSSASGGRFE